jgi:hypothetical protein
MMKSRVRQPQRDRWQFLELRFRVEKAPEQDKLRRAKRAAAWLKARFTEGGRL